MHPIFSLSRVNLWLGQDCAVDEKYISKEGFARATWTDICTGALISSGRVASAVVDQEYPVLSRIVLMNDQEPDDFIRSQPFDNGHPWIAAGARGDDAAKLRGLVSSGATIYWLTNWDEPVPAEVDFPVTPISGFDPDSFFAVMLRGEFPPAPASRQVQFEDPLKDLDRMFQEIRQHYRAKAEAGYHEFSAILKQVEDTADIDAFLAKVRTATRRTAVISGEHHYAAAGVSVALLRREVRRPQSREVVPLR